MSDERILVWDTETTGFTQDDLPLDHPKQPKLVSIAATLFTPQAKVLAGFDLIVRPDLDASGKPLWKSDPGAEKAHGITTEIALAFGISRRVAVAAFTNLRAVADVIVAHNRKFDEKVMDCQLAEMKVKPSSPWPEKRVCTSMTDSVTALVGLPATPKQRRYYPDKKHKAPNLTELHTFLFGVGFEGVHGAGPDRDACARCYFELVKRGAL